MMIEKKNISRGEKERGGENFVDTNKKFQLLKKRNALLEYYIYDNFCFERQREKDMEKTFF